MRAHMLASCCTHMLSCGQHDQEPKVFEMITLHVEFMGEINLRAYRVLYVLLGLVKSYEAFDSLMRPRALHLQVLKLPHPRGLIAVPVVARAPAPEHLLVDRLRA